MNDLELLKLADAVAGNIELRGATDD